MNELIEENMKVMAPVLKSIAKQQELFIRSLNLPVMIPIFKEMANIAEHQAKFAKLIEPSINFMSFIHQKDTSYYLNTERLKNHIEYEETFVSEVIKPTGQFINFDKASGNFFYKNRKIDFSKEEAIYVLLLKALFAHCDEDGFCSYDRIDRFLEEAGKTKLPSKSAKEKRIHNALIVLFRARDCQSISFPKLTPEGKPVICVKRSKGIVFNNPQI